MLHKLSFLGLYVVITIIVSVIMFALIPAGAAPRVAHNGALKCQVVTCFTPRDANYPMCEPLYVSYINRARKQILVQGYSFTDHAIAAALVAAKRRGVDVRAIFDRSDYSGRGELLGELDHAGIPVAIDAKHAIAHNKVMVLDGEIVFEGSFNFTESAERRNAEDGNVLICPALAQEYAANWNIHLKHSVPLHLYTPKSYARRH